VFIMIISVNIWYVAVMACCVYIRYVLLVFHPLTIIINRGKQNQTARHNILIKGTLSQDREARVD
jgi:hypothetical protein